MFQQTDRTQVKTHPALRDGSSLPTPFLSTLYLQNEQAQCWIWAEDETLHSLVTSSAFPCLVKCSVHHQSSTDLVKIFLLRWGKRRVLRGILSLALRLSSGRSSISFSIAVCIRRILLELLLASCPQGWSGCFLWQLQTKRVTFQSFQGAKEELYG